jgi:spermidine/putrescine transport system permease protein
MVKKIFAKSYVALILCIMYAPIFVLMAFSFTEATLIGNWSGFSLKLYSNLFKNKEIMEALKNTILIALSSAIVSTILGTLGAIGIYYSKKRMRKTFNFIGQIPVLNPEIVTALSLTILFVFLGIKFNFITLMIGHVVLTIPFVVLSITPKLKQMDPNIYEAALDLGAKPSMALRKVIIPEIIPGVLSGFILAVTLSLDDYIITAFTRNNSFQTISTYVYGVTAKKGALPPTLRALTTIIFLFTLLLLIFINIRSKKKEVKR